MKMNKGNNVDELNEKEFQRYLKLNGFDNFQLDTLDYKMLELLYFQSIQISNLQFYFTLSTNLLSMPIVKTEEDKQKEKEEERQKLQKMIEVINEKKEL